MTRYRRERIHVKVDDQTLAIVEDLKVSLGTGSISEIVRRALFTLRVLPDMEAQEGPVNATGVHGINVEITPDLKAFLDRRKGEGIGHRDTLAVAVRILTRVQARLADKDKPIRRDDPEALFLTL